MITLIETPNSKLTYDKFDNEPLLQQCVADVAPLLLHHPEIRIFGKIAHQRRDVGFFSNTSKGYQYSGQIAVSQKLTANLQLLLDTVNHRLQSNFNGILVNRYQDGSDYISPHSDDERFLDPKIGVVSISYGAQRVFRIRWGSAPSPRTPLLGTPPPGPLQHKRPRSIVGDFPVDNLSILHMSGDFQKEFTHEIPMDKTITGTRYSFTFRCHTE